MVLDDVTPVDDFRPAHTSAALRLSMLASLDPLRSRPRRYGRQSRCSRRSTPYQAGMSHLASVWESSLRSRLHSIPTSSAGTGAGAIAVGTWWQLVRTVNPDHARCSAVGHDGPHLGCLCLAWLCICCAVVCEGYAIRLKTPEAERCSIDLGSSFHARGVKLLLLICSMISLQKHMQFHPSSSPSKLSLGDKHWCAGVYLEILDEILNPH